MSNFVEKPSTSSYGGRWSDTKLDALSEYLSAYTIALSKQPFSRIYIDAFAGAGRQIFQKSRQMRSFFPDEGPDGKQYRHGSPIRALNAEPPFHKFIFIEKDEKALSTLKNEIQSQGLSEKPIQYIHGDANIEIPKICDSIHWKSHRAVIFIDPFATEVQWPTIETIQDTKAMDMWLLFPAMAVNRMLMKSGDIPELWQSKLTECFGTDEWKDVFYQSRSQPTFLDDDDDFVEKGPEVFNTLSKFVNYRLKSIFPGVSKKGLVLSNSTGTPLFLLYFACSNPNPKAFGLALKIANQIIEKSQ